MEASREPNHVASHVATPPWQSPSQDSEGENNDVVTDMEPLTRLKRMRTLLGRVSEQGPRVMRSLDLAAAASAPPTESSASPHMLGPRDSPVLASSLLARVSKDTAKSAEWDVEDDEDMHHGLKPGIIDPGSRWYRWWYGLILVVAAGSGFLTPWQLAFTPPHFLYSVGHFLVCLDLLMTVLFGLDVYLTTYVAVRDASDRLVDDRPAIIQHYRREGTLYVDLVGLLPLDWILVGLLGGTARLPPSLLTCLSLLRLLQLARLVRLIRLFSYLEYDTRLSLLWVTMARNLTLLAYLINWFACFFSLVSQGTTAKPIPGGRPPRFDTILEQYLGSLYWALETLTSPQYGNEAPKTRWQLAAATARIGLFMAYDIAIGAYIMGTISLLVVKADERTGQFRDRAANLKQFVQQHSIPADLRQSMQEHLSLHFHNEEASDESVLGIYPTTLRRRILRHLYGRYIQTNYLFAGARQKFLDALLAACRIELYMPHVDILTEGEAVNELCLVVDGNVEIITTSTSADPPMEAEPPPSAAPPGPAGGAGEAAGQRRIGRVGSLKRQLGIGRDEVLHRTTVGPGCCFGEVAFFTEIPQHEVVRSVTVCRVMVVSRSAYNSVVSSFPVAARTVLSNLQRALEHNVASAFPNLKHSQSFQRVLRHSPSTLVRHTAGLGLRTAASSPLDDSAHPSEGELEWRELLEGPLTARQAALVGNLHRTRTVLTEHVSKMDAERVTAFLYACSLGHIHTVRMMLQEGFPPDEADYDGRTGLMLACVKGNEGIARELVAAGADPLRPDTMGTSALLEAVNNGQDKLISFLTGVGARLSYGRGSVMDAVRLCTCVFEYDLPRLRRLLKAGITVDAGDYDLRTALHICASESNLVMVRVLIEEGQADMHKRDRWGNTPLHEAIHVGAHQVVAYMRERLEERGLPQDLALLEGTSPAPASPPRALRSASGKGSAQNFNAYREHTAETTQPRPTGRTYTLFRKINSSISSSMRRKGKAGGYGR